MSEYSEITATFPEKKTAKRIAKLLVEKRLAACAQTFPIDSVYRWQGEVFEEGEIKLIIKTKTALFDEVAAVIKANHSYEVPEIVQTPITGGTPEYLKWISDSTQ